MYNFFRFWTTMYQPTPTKNKNASFSARTKQSLAALDLEHLNLTSHGGGQSFSRYLSLPTSHEMQSSRSLQDLHMGQQKPSFNGIPGFPNHHLMQSPQLMSYCCNPYMCTCSHNNRAVPNIQINVWSEDLFRSEAIDVADIDYPEGDFPRGGPRYPRRHRFIDGIIPRIKLRECPDYTIGECRKPSVTYIPEAFPYKPPGTAENRVKKVDPDLKPESTSEEASTDDSVDGDDMNLEQ